MKAPNINRESAMALTQTLRHFNLAQLLVPAVVKMFSIGRDGIYRGEVKGVSDDTRAEMKALGMTEFARRLIEPMFSKGWHFSPCGIVAKEKTKGGYRFILASCDRDRIRQRAIYNVIGPLLDPLFFACTYGYRPGRGHQDAVAFLSRLMWERRFDTLLLLDVRRCFPSIDIETALTDLSKIIGDKRILGWMRDDLQTRPPQHRIDRIEHELRAGGKASDRDFAYLAQLRQREIGIREGSSLSPLVCNLYLRPIIKLIKDFLPGAGVVQYADNLAILCQRNRVEQVYRLKDTVDRQHKLVLEFEHTIHKEEDQVGEFLGQQVAWKSGKPYLTPPDEAVMKLVGKVKAVLNVETSATEERKPTLIRALSAIANYRVGSIEPIYKALNETIPDKEHREYVLQLARQLHDRTSTKTFTDSDDFLGFWPYPEIVLLEGDSYAMGPQFAAAGDSSSLPLAVNPPRVLPGDQAV